MTYAVCPTNLLGLWETSETATGSLRNLFRQTQEDLSQADTWNRFKDTESDLIATYRECSQDNWDGYGGRAVTAGAFEEAMAILQAVPAAIPVPEISAEPDGSIALEWYKGPHRMLSLSVSGKGMIFFAGLFGNGNKAHGSEVFDDSIPAEIIRLLERLLGKTAT